jgi:hypothetical protein
MTADELSEIINAAFPIAPVPERFWVDDNQPSVGDIPEELAKRIAHRPWVDVTMLDWTMTGAHASTSKVYIDPNAFRYYLPSLLIGGLSDLGYIDWPLESLLPTGRKRRITGKWWQEFWTGFSDEQKDVVRAYLISVQPMLREAIHPSELHLIDEALVLWGRRNDNSPRDGLNMGYAPRIVLQLPVANLDLLEPFVETCLRDGVDLIAIVGDGASKMEDLIDEIVVGDGSDWSRFVVTSFHENETVEEVLEFARNWKKDQFGQTVELVKL